ncbi:glycosyltransferase family 4 protein [Paramicrobacterium fandaimingii]|uniref:glycosyltransferase family 4 protein n=1 Tax=Paramicrobacterium fandaimingii TaxID=2708079 RepID=UPI00141ECD8D|nr:glycosyltransferase family 4 protein [Microbacterium fandaimingii]
MRITIVSRIFAPEPGAASLRLKSLVEALAHAGAQVDVMTTAPPASKSGQTDMPARVSRWPVLRDSSGYVRGYLQYMSFDIPAFFRVLFHKRIDVIVVEPPPTTGLFVRLGSALRRIPYVYFAADIWSDAAGSTGAASWIVSGVRFIEKLALSGATHVIAVSDAVADRVKTLAPTAHVTVAGHGVDTSLFTPEGAAPAEPADIVYVGTASEWHGASVALDVVIALLTENIELTAAFIGQGSEWLSLKQRAEKSSVSARIRVLPTVVPEEAAMWLRSARVSIATLKPGLGYDFAVPTKIYSSLASGTPVAYAGPDPVRSMVVDNRLGVATDYDAELLTQQLRALLEGSGELSASSMRAWTQDNVSATAVAGRAATAIMQSARHDA